MMSTLAENVYYKKAKRLKPSRFMFLLIFSLIFLTAQLIFIYLKFIPAVLQPYEGLLPPEVQDHVRLALEKIVVWFIVWPLMFFGIIGAMIYNSRNIQKLIESLHNIK